ncbi:MAG: gamma-glutamylcyclotransferase [Limisphaerales bacterium]
MTAKRQHQQRKDQPASGSHLVFVYGTLRRGCWNHGLLAKAEFVGAGKTKRRYAMYVDAIPYVVKEEVSQIVGEVYAVDQGTLRDLDSLEGYPSWYERQEVDVALDDGRQIVAWMYFSRQPQGKLNRGGDFLDGADPPVALSRPVLRRRLGQAS